MFKKAIEMCRKSTSKKRFFPIVILGLFQTNNICAIYWVRPET